MTTRSRKPSLRRKNFVLDQVKIDRARELLGTATETETITRALDTVNELARFRAEVDSGLDNLVGRGGFEDLFPATR